MSTDTQEAEPQDFMAGLEQGVRDVLKNRKATAADKIGAINAGVKLLAIRHQINGGDETNFFDKKAGT